VRRAFTLAELMIVIAIIAIMAGLALSAMSGATNLAREHRTQAQIRKIDLLLTERWEGYRTRSLALRIPPGIDPRTAALIRLNGLRDLMRMEMPDRVTDVVDGPAVLTPNGMPPVSLARPMLQLNYQRQAARSLGPNWARPWTAQYQGAECLYLILSTMGDGDKRALDYFDSSEIGDVDGDGMREILDGWGTPIEFLRWAPGYLAPDDYHAAITMQISDWNKAPDPFDPAKADPRWRINGAAKPFMLYPLIVSAGPDRQIDIGMRLTDTTGGQFHYSTTSPPNDPYHVPTEEIQLGTPVDFNNDGPGWADNITNHAQSQ
jgi:prepilin-type N-terminal cleavage/methylation domain-containing protein